MTSYSHLPYRLGVGVILLNKQRRVFVGKRIDNTSEAWQMPQGGVDPGEAYAATAMRELKEEIGTDNATILAESNDWYYYDLPDALVPIIWKGQYRGQQQRWFVMQFEGSDAEININTPEPEFCAWQWVAPAQLPDLSVPFKRVLYQELLHEFAPFL